MSGSTDQKHLENSLLVLGRQNEENLEEIMNIWQSLYGSKDANMGNRLLKLHGDFKVFWEGEVEVERERQKNFSNNIERLCKQALELEKALGVQNGVDNLRDDLPLVEMEEQLWKMLNTYNEIKDQRMEKYNIMRSKEQELCSILREDTLLRDFSKTNTKCLEGHYVVELPTPEDMLKCEERLKELERLKDQMEYEFIKYKHELQTLLNECDVPPFTKPEHYAYSLSEQESDFPVTKENLELLKASTEEYRNKKNELLAETNHLKEEITLLSKKMLKNQEEIQSFLDAYDGFTKSTIAKLKEKLSALKDERKHKLKELILSHREMLDDIWNRSCYTDEQRSKFRPYHVNHYSEDVLNFHELEVEQMEHFYNSNKRIFELANIHDELWARLLELEQLASDVNRLFSNRGGMLLQEEKERKRIQKKLPAIKAELLTLLIGFKVNNGCDFLRYGVSLQETLEQLEKEHENAKANKKLQRKNANTENVMLESRMGARPVTVKRKAPPPQSHITPNKIVKLSAHSSTQNSAASSTKYTPVNEYQMVVKESELPLKMTRGQRSPGCIGGKGGPGMSSATLRTPIRTPAASTPENGSPSYESFQEHIEKSKEVCRSSTKPATKRVLRSRNVNISSKVCSSKATPVKTPKTPARTPSKIPFRIATGSKIPSIVPPLSPRNTAKLTTPRSKLPLIF